MSGPSKNKALGQHFLREPRIARRILEAAEIEPHHRVLEIGPGDGVLTGALCEAAAEVVAIEADDRFADLLEGKFSNLKLVRGDALQVDLEALGPFDRIVSNLPYQISGPVTARFLDLFAAQGWGIAVLMYQKEFADRLLAGPGTKKYGRLSVYTSRYCKVSKIRDVPPGCFDPPPKVSSTVVKLVPHAKMPFEVRNEEAWRRIINGAFSQRRKQLKNTVLGVELGDLATFRPEQVTPAQFAELANGA